MEEGEQEQEEAEEEGEGGKEGEKLEGEEEGEEEDEEEEEDDSDEDEDFRKRPYFSGKPDFCLSSVLKPTLKSNCIYDRHQLDGWDVRRTGGFILLDL